MRHTQVKSACTEHFPATLRNSIGAALERKIVSLSEQVRDIEYSSVESKQAVYLKQVISNLENQLSEVRDQTN